MKTNLLIGCTGSVATIKLPIIIKLFLESNQQFEIKVILTKHAEHFVNKEEIPSHVTIIVDEDEWVWKNRGDPVLHIELGKWADICLIAPLDANSLAKISTGICDNLLTCTVRAWDFSKPLLFCPAMNTRMYEHPLTREQINKLKSWGYIEMPTVSKTLMCGDTGNGAMAEVDMIVRRITDLLLIGNIFTKSIAK